MSTAPVTLLVLSEPTPTFLDGGGACGRLIAERDWSTTPLGPIHAWPQSLRTSVAILLRSPVPIVLLWGSDGVMLYNDAYSVFAGGRHPHLLGSNVREGWPEVADFNDAVMRTGWDGGTLHYRDQELVLHRHGRPERVWLNLDYSPVLDESGRPGGVICILADTTERVSAERRSGFLLSLADDLRALGRQDEIVRLASARIAGWLDANRVFFAEITDAGWMTVADDHRRGVQSLAGRHSLESFGPGLLQAYRSGQPLVACDIPADESLTPDTRAGLAERQIAAFIDIMLFNESDRVHVFAVQSATPRAWTSAEITLVQDVGERVKAAVERARAEEELRALNETLEAQVATRAAERDRLWNLSQDMLARADYQGMMSAVSPAWTQVLGWSENELLSRGYASFMHIDDALHTLVAIAGMEQTRQPTRFQNRIATLNGGWKHIEWTVAPEADGLNFVAVGRDLTEAKAQEADLLAAQDALRQSQKMEAMGSLTGGVAHDFNNLLTPIIGSLDMLIRKQVGSPRERRLIEGALQSAERAKTLVQRLLAFARRQPLQPTAVDVARVVDSMVELVGATVGPTIAIRIDVAADLPPAKADLNQLEMALLNLAVNARDAMPQGGELTIAARRRSVMCDNPTGLARGHYVCLSVRDTGIGMDAETVQRAVEPFFSTKGIGKGTGLGLSMVHGLAAQLGGGLTIDSAPGQGATISLWLPLGIAAAVEPRVGGRTAPSRGSGVALLVDDEDLVRMSTADMLADMNYHVVEAASAEEALALIGDGLIPDLLVTDHLMTGMNGAQLARALKGRLPGLPVLIVSGYAEEDGIDSDLPRLTKPFRNAELASSLTMVRGGMTM